MVKSEITPKHDSTLGLIFRLNGLWSEADRAAINGLYDDWNNVLDAIWRNLSYRDKMEVEKDSKENIIKVDLSKEDKKVYKFLSAGIIKYKMKHRTSTGRHKGVLKKQIYRGLWYNELMRKDIWLRKHMNMLKLYIKETTNTPGAAMWGY